MNPLDPPYALAQIGGKAVVRADELVYNVRDYLPTGWVSGTTNVTTQINDLIDAVSAGGGGVIFFPRGVYVGNFVGKPGVILTGQRHAFGYIPSGVSPVRLQAPPSGGTVIDTPGAPIQGFSVQGLDVNSGSGPNTLGIRLRQADWCSIKCVNINDMQDQGLLVDDGVGCVIEDVLITSSLLNRTRSVDVGGLELGGTDHFIRNIEVSTYSHSLSSGAAHICSMLIKASNSFFVNAVAEISDRGCVVTGSYNRFSNVRADTNQASDWDIQGGGNQFSACAASNGGIAAANTYPGWKVSGAGNTFTACTTYQQNAATYSYSFEDLVNQSSPLARSRWEGCIGAGYATQEFSTQYFLGSAPTVPDSPTRPSSGTTFDMTATQFVIPQHAGATTITNFINGISAQHAYIVGNPNITLQNNSTLKTSTGADKVLVADRIYHFMLYGAVWIEVGP